MNAVHRNTSLSRNPDQCGGIGYRNSMAKRLLSNSGMGVKLSLGTCRVHCSLRGRDFALRMMALEDAASIQPPTAARRQPFNAPADNPRMK